MKKIGVIKLVLAALSLASCQKEQPPTCSCTEVKVTMVVEADGAIALVNERTSTAPYCEELFTRSGDTLIYTNCHFKN